MKFVFSFHHFKAVEDIYLNKKDLQDDDDGDNQKIIKIGVKNHFDCFHHLREKKQAQKGGWLVEEDATTQQLLAYIIFSTITKKNMKKKNDKLERKRQPKNRIA